MDWIILFVSILVIWVASIFKILLLSVFPSSVEQFNNGDVVGRKAFLLVIAHPDDESMFFTPTINYLTSRGRDIHVICLSMGNADGMGSVRNDELYKACGTLKVCGNNEAVQFINDWLQLWHTTDFRARKKSSNADNFVVDDEYDSDYHDSDAENEMTHQI